jgi:hypothetical protein
VISLVLLALAGVESSAIADDYLLSAAAPRAQGTTSPERSLTTQELEYRQTILNTLDRFDAASYLKTGGFNETQIRDLCRRLIANTK